MSVTPRVRESSRYRSLDGLRGLAAAVVVLHHSLLTVAIFAEPYFATGIVGDPGSAAWWLTYTPLHAVWDGTAAVYTFFVLSGAVLTLPAVRSARFRWSAYYPQRLVRLYLPVWVAVGIAALNILLIPRGPASSDWLSANVDRIDRKSVISDLGLLNGHGFLMSPLWSLHWEVLFSLLLPGFVAIAVRLRAKSFFMLPIALISVGAGAALQVPELEFLPMFLIGCIVALQLEKLGEFTQRAGRRPWTPVALISVVLISAPWWIRPLGGGLLVSRLLEPLAVLGACGLVLAAVHSEGLRRILESRHLQYLGLISFSWYLVHEPIVIGLAHLTGTDRPYIAIPLGIVVSLAVAHGFHLVIERPSQRLARRVGTLTSKWTISSDSRKMRLSRGHFPTQIATPNLTQSHAEGRP